MRSFSALLRAEKSEIAYALTGYQYTRSGFSALLRAEKSEIIPSDDADIGYLWFQCSSASRKIGNATTTIPPQSCTSVSVLFCEPKNRKLAHTQHNRMPPTMFQCSSASRKIGNLHFWDFLPAERAVSVLFCEPKNRKFNAASSSSVVAKRFQCSSASRKIGNASESWTTGVRLTFQCSSASRKIGNGRAGQFAWDHGRFQCSSASRKIGNPLHTKRSHDSNASVSVLFCEPKNRKFAACVARALAVAGFSALLRAEKSEIQSRLSI